MKNSSENQTIHIVAATDENYWHLLAVMLMSLVSNHRTPEKVVAHILASNLTEEQKRDFVDFFRPRGLELDWLTMDPASFKDFPVSDYFTCATYYRVEIPRLLARDISKVIYLDVDVLILDDISKLWRMDTGGMPMAAVENFHSHHKEFVGIPAGSKFFNGGVLIIDLDYWRTHNVSAELKKMILTQREKMIYCDQEALNLIFHDKCCFLDPKWNYNPEHEDVIELFSLHTRRPGLREAVKRPSLVHFYGARKPDNFWDFSVYADKYRAYFRRIPFIKDRLARPTFDQAKRKFWHRFDRIMMPYWFRRLRLQSDTRKQKAYYPGLPDWYW